MKPISNLLLIIFSLLCIQGCNTLYNSRIIQIEVMKPGKLVFPSYCRNVAIRCNNSNVSFNPFYAKYFQIKDVFSDTTNIDSIAATIYFDAFAENLKKQNFFDSITELVPANYSGDFFIDPNQPEDQDSLSKENENVKNTHLLRQLISKYPGKSTVGGDTIRINPDTGLYTKKQLKQIADSTHADLLISLDFFCSIDGTTYVPELTEGYRYVLTEGIWNLYNLKRLDLEFAGNRIDTVSWNESGSFPNEFMKLLPPRRDAILNAAEISGSKFAELIIPHWSREERLYYRSGHLELKNAEPLIKKGKWLEAAEIWKANIDNPNKNIAAKCMFNLGLACEMEGDVDAAIDWVVRSYHVFKQKNEVNALNCTDYLQTLGKRKLDFKRIEYQLNPQSLNEEGDE